ncbi:MAG: hypothetical protein V4671_04910 [Armatimonadota bacterium]
MQPQVITLGSALAALTFSGAAPILHDKVRRPARLFVAGDYPDKGIHITPDDLTRIVANFSTAKNPVPVKTEHSDTPLDPLGEVAALYVEGSELYGVLVFSSGMDAHIRERGVEHLSVALVREEDGSFRLKETSLVFTPRVASAGFLTPALVEQKLAAFAAQGKLTPAMRQSAARLLSAPQVVTFSDGSELSVAAEAEALLSAMPVVQPRGSVARTGQFAGPAEGPSEYTRQFADRFGADPAKVHEILRG